MNQWQLPNLLELIETVATKQTRLPDFRQLIVFISLIQGHSKVLTSALAHVELFACFLLIVLRDDDTTN